MAILVLWLAVIFASFGLFAPRNSIVAATLFVAALSVAGSIYLILAMDQPYSGPIKISSAPLRIALDSANPSPLRRTDSNRPLCRDGSPDKEEQDSPYRGYQQIAEPTFELEVHQLRQRTADERPRYADQKISKQAMIARSYFLSDPAGEDANNQHAKKADTGLHLNIAGWFLC